MRQPKGVIKSLLHPKQGSQPQKWSGTGKNSLQRYTHRYRVGDIPAVPPGLSSSDPHALVVFFECVDYHEYFGTVRLEHDHWYQFKQAILYRFVDSRISIARSSSALPRGNLHSQKKGRVL